MISELFVYLLAGTYEGHSIYTGHDCLFYCFSLNISKKFPGDGVVIGRGSFEIVLYHLNNHFRYVGVDIAGFGCGSEVDLIGSLGVPSHGCVVLQSIATSVLVDVQERLVFLGAGAFHCC